MCVSLAPGGKTYTDARPAGVWRGVAQIISAPASLLAFNPSMAEACCRAPHFSRDLVISGPQCAKLRLGSSRQDSARCKRLCNGDDRRRGAAMNTTTWASEQYGNREWALRGVRYPPHNGTLIQPHSGGAGNSISPVRPTRAQQPACSRSPPPRDPQQPNSDGRPSHAGLGARTRGFPQIDMLGRKHTTLGRVRDGGLRTFTTCGTKQKKNNISTCTGTAGCVCVLGAPALQNALRRTLLCVSPCLFCKSSSGVFRPPLQSEETGLELCRRSEVLACVSGVVCVCVRVAWSHIFGVRCRTFFW